MHTTGSVHSSREEQEVEVTQEPGPGFGTDISDSCSRTGCDCCVMSGKLFLCGGPLEKKKSQRWWGGLPDLGTPETRARVGFLV